MNHIVSFSLQQYYCPFSFSLSLQKKRGKNKYKWTVQKVKLCLGFDVGDTIFLHVFAAYFGLAASRYILVWLGLVRFG